MNLLWIDNEIIKKQKKHLRKITSNYLEKYLDVYNLFVDSRGEPITDYFFDDGVHIIREGYEVWANEVKDFLSLKSSE